MKENMLVLQNFVCIQMYYKWVRTCLFLKNNIASEGAVSHKVLYYLKLSVACLRYFNRYFEYLQIVYSAFKGITK